MQSHCVSHTELFQRYLGSHSHTEYPDHVDIAIKISRVSSRTLLIWRKCISPPFYFPTENYSSCAVHLCLSLRLISRRHDQLGTIISFVLCANLVQVHTVTATEPGLREQSLPLDIETQWYREHRNYPVLSSFSLRRLRMVVLRFHHGFAAVAWYDLIGRQEWKWIILVLVEWLSREYVTFFAPLRHCTIATLRFWQELQANIFVAWTANSHTFRSRFIVRYTLCSYI